MDLLYNVNRKSYSKSFLNQESPYSECSICTISCRNIVAFTATSDLEGTNSKIWGCHIYVCDLNRPWHIVSTNKDLVTVLKWDLSGEQLVVANCIGVVQLWTFKDYVLNNWQLIASHYFIGEHILDVAWFHNGKRISLISEKKDCTQYSDKFSHLLYAPTVKQFGGCASQGVLVVTNTGMLGAILITQDKQNLVYYSTESLRSIRQRVSAVDISYAKNGEFLVAVSSGSCVLPIRCFRVSVKKVGEKYNIVSHALPSFFLQDGTFKDNPFDITISHLKFAASETADSLIVAANNDSDGFIEIWELSEKTPPVHKGFQSKNCESFKTYVWQHQALYHCSYCVTAVTTTKISINKPTCYITVALSDASVRCLSLDGLKEISSSTLNNNFYQDETVNKYLKVSTTVSYIDISWLGCICVLMDSKGNLHVYKLPTDGTSLSLAYSCTLLEYCLLTGTDWLDLLICLRPPTIEALSERFDTFFNKQPLPIQQYYYMQFLNIKISLYRMLINGQNKAADLSSLFMMLSVATAFKSLLRPSETFHDKVPADRLQSVITDNIITDVDKVLLHIEPKEFTVEPITLQSLQQLIQWTTNFALNLLVRLPEQKLQNKSSGYEILRDQKAINILRELLVIIRIWGLLRPSCLPVFLKSADNIDVLGLLFQLLSKLIQPSNEVHHFDDHLIDDCCLLPNQIMIPQVQEANSITAIATPILFYQNVPLQLEYGVEPDFTFVPELNPVEGCMHSGQTVDAVRHIYLGKQPLFVKQCSRCGSKSQIQNTTRTAAIRAWEQRWAKGCPCGGSWTINNSNIQ
ncbi:mediator of RNA polymerase II transcription subunit 16 isoform X2 [Phymastichus coffea]|uniref:mediator of RNA polymerase II transcription subunit 16 isoform X2 n=1 Tax=Phymastichus coffea TaxID=108790 RepID=UPI00273CC22E|nr:mediator of RNA polymerase II transcription subunit 16 isoform X2 [Phymastichus coffea]